MSSAELIQYLILGTIAICTSIALIMGFAGGLLIEPYIRKVASALLPTLLLFALGISTLFSGRNTALYGVSGEMMSRDASGLESWILRIATAATVGISVMIVAAASLSKTSRKNAARPLFLYFCLYFFASYVVSGIFGTVPTMSYKTFYPFIVVFALYVTSDYNEELLLQLARDGLLLMLFVGLCLIPLKPELVMQKTYQGIIPGLSGRFWGLASHANNTGPLAVFNFLLICWLPYKNRLFTFISIALCVITLVLAQSKTAFISAILVVSVFVYRVWFEAIFGKNVNPAASFLAIALTMLLAIFVLITFVADIYSQSFDQLISMIQGRGTLLTGRENIWSITMAEWQKNPLFGYGPNLWGEEFSARFGYLGVASNAHNQIFDTLGAAGVLGVITLAIYIFVLVWYAIQLAGISKWVSIALIVFIGTRCFSEVPLKTMNITTSDFIMQAIVIGLFMRVAQRREKGMMQTTPLAIRSVS